jgi:hypothetical protein
MTETQTLEIIEVLNALPAEKVAEVRDFAIFLRERYTNNQTVDESDEWTEEDLQDVTIASLRYVEKIEDEVTR